MSFQEKIYFSHNFIYIVNFPCIKNRFMWYLLLLILNRHEVTLQAHIISFVSGCDSHPGPHNTIVYDIDQADQIQSKQHLSVIISIISVHDFVLSKSTRILFLIIFFLSNNIDSLYMKFLNTPRNGILFY